MNKCFRLITLIFHTVNNIKISEFCVITTYVWFLLYGILNKWPSSRWLNSFYDADCLSNRIVGMQLPKALYGWNSVQKSPMIRLERAHRECIKCIQRLPRNTLTVFSLGALGMFLKLKLKLQNVNLYSLGRFVDFLINKWSDKSLIYIYVA